jgi:hypothetical protein
MYCECPKGWAGNKCEIKSEECGDIGYCYNGAKCMSGIDMDTGNPIYHCNCLHAKSSNNTSFAGTYCQIPATITCTTNISNQHNGNQFCTNQGSCNVEETHKGCECPSGFHGPMCEYQDSETVPRTCDLKCQNGGECRLGPKDTSLLDQLVGSDQEIAHLNITHTSNLMHCVCPEGFFGLTCETRLQICSLPSDKATNGVVGGAQTVSSAIEHVCLHGSVCSSLRDENGNVHHSCDCNTVSDTNTKFAGRFCQFAATTYCTPSGRPGSGSLSNNFCVNNGVCKSPPNSISGHPGCNCLNGWEGEHCEYPKGLSPKAPTNGPATSPTRQSDQLKGSNDKKKKDGPSDGAVVFLVLLSLAGVAGLLGVVIPRVFLARKEFDTAKGDIANTTADLEPSVEESNGTFEDFKSPSTTGVQNGEDPEWNSVSLGPSRSII